MKGFLYFDLKPANVMLGTGSDADNVYLLDWGCLRSYREMSGKFLPAAIEAGNDSYRSVHNHEGTCK